MKRNKTMVIVLALLVLAGGGVYLALRDRTPFAEKKPAVGELAPEISLADLSGNMVKLSDHEGKVVLVNFWASWCPPCKSEMPYFQKAFEAYEPKGFAVIGIALDEVSPPLIRDLGVGFPVVVTNPRVTRDYGDISDVPVSFLIGRDGKIIKKVRKVYPEDMLMADLEKALHR